MSHGEATRVGTGEGQREGTGEGEIVESIVRGTGKLPGRIGTKYIIYVNRKRGRLSGLIRITITSPTPIKCRASLYISAKSDSELPAMNITIR